MLQRLKTTLALSLLISGFSSTFAMHERGFGSTPFGSPTNTAINAAMRIAEKNALKIEAPLADSPDTIALLEMGDTVLEAANEDFQDKVHDNDSSSEEEKSPAQPNPGIQAVEDTIAELKATPALVLKNSQKDQVKAEQITLSESDEESVATAQHDNESLHSDVILHGSDGENIVSENEEAAEMNATLPDLIQFPEVPAAELPVNANTNVAPEEVQDARDIPEVLVMEGQQLVLTQIADTVQERNVNVAPEAPAPVNNPVETASAQNTANAIPQGAQAQPERTPKFYDPAVRAAKNVAGYYKLDYLKKNNVRDMSLKNLKDHKAKLLLTFGLYAALVGAVGGVVYRIAEFFQKPQPEEQDQEDIEVNRPVIVKAQRR